MPPAKKRTRSYDPAKIRTAVSAQFGNVRQAVRALGAEQLARPTRLGDWTVRELAAHVTLAVESVSRNLDREEPAKAELALLDWPFATAARAAGIADDTRRLAEAHPDLDAAHGSIALGHNGNLVNTAQLAEMVADLPKQEGGRTPRVAATNDTDLLTALLAAQVDEDGKPLTIEEAAGQVLPQVRGAFSLVFMDENTLYAARDPQGIRPLVLGRLERGWVVASESAALDICGASYVREIEPGEFVAIDENGLRTSRFAEAKPKGCVFEYVYLARPDTDIAGRNVYLSRVEMGRKLAKEAPVEADLVIATPESGTPAAIGYAEASGIPFGAGLVKNAYVGRTFIQPSQTIRQLGIRLKLNPLKEVIKGKRLVVVDDSIVRGNTQRALVRMLREAGAAEVHIRISSPPVKWPCFFGIDFATRAELIANGMTIDEIGTSLGADSLAYISIDGMIEATTIAKPNLCRACFDGEYPMELPDPELLGKQLLETELAAGPAATAAADAIRRP
ncbi:Amidophosphoribosyltransferase OS=Streptomyces violarus OX=67380 GN=purF PE=3 SV=1 [Streptomyces violarus]